MDAAEALVLPRDLVFVDLETTGGNPAQHRITEVGIVRMAGGEVVEEWSSLVNPECAIPPYIESFTGITNDMVAGAPRFADLARVILAKLGSVANGRATGVRRAQRPLRLLVSCAPSFAGSSSNFRRPCCAP